MIYQIEDWCYMKRNLNKIKYIFLYQKTLTLVRAMKYPRITKDKSLIYKPPVEYITSKAIKDL